MCSGESVNRTLDFSFTVAVGDNFVNEPHISGGICSSVLVILVATIRKERLMFVSLYSVSTPNSVLFRAIYCFGLRTKQAVISSRGV